MLKYYHPALERRKLAHQIGSAGIRAEHHFIIAVQSNVELASEVFCKFGMV